MVPIPADPLQPWPDVTRTGAGGYVQFLSSVPAIKVWFSGINMLNAWQNGPAVGAVYGSWIEISQLCLVYQKVPMATPQLPMKFLDSKYLPIHPKHRVIVVLYQPLRRKCLELMSVHRSFPKSSKGITPTKVLPPLLSQLCFPTFMAVAHPPKRRWTSIGHVRRLCLVKRNILQLINGLTSSQPLQRWKRMESGWLVGIGIYHIGLAGKKTPRMSFKMEKNFLLFVPSKSS